MLGHSASISVREENIQELKIEHLIQRNKYDKTRILIFLCKHKKMSVQLHQNLCEYDNLNLQIIFLLSEFEELHAHNSLPKVVIALFYLLLIYHLYY